MNILIKNGIVDGYPADIFISHEKIQKIGVNLMEEDSQIIDASGNLVLPGGVDVHTHMDLDLGKYRVVDDFYTGTVAAAFGGTTTIIDHLAFGPKGCGLKHQLGAYHALADDKSIIDYSFHGVFQHVNEAVLEEMDELAVDGITSFKIYMTYDNLLSDEEILKVLARARKNGAVIAVHAENDGAIKYLRQSYFEAGKTAPFYHALSRPDATEAEAINRMIYLSEIAGYPHLYFVHVSTKKGLDEIISARKRGAKNIWCETCTQYLVLTQDKYYEDNYQGLKYIMAPPLRQKGDVEALWEGIENNDVDVIATDHCPFFINQKMDRRDDFRIAPGGIPGVEERMEIVLTEGLKRGIPLSLLVEKLSEKPAKIYGLYPRKGTLKPGSDGDIIILTKNKKTITPNNRHGASDYTPYEGFVTVYTVDTVIQRGNILVTQNKLVAQKGCGEFFKRDRVKIEG